MTSTTTIPDRPARAVLRVPGFRLLTAGQFTSTVGDYCYAIALPWLVLSSHGGTELLGAVLACYGVPRVALIPAGGVLADRIGARRLMLGADLARCVVVALLAWLAVQHDTSLAALGPAAAVIGAGEGLFLPASYSIMPSLLGPDLLGAGNAISTAAVQTGSLIGPALGGALVATTGGTPVAFGIDAASFAVSALSLLLIGRVSQPVLPAPAAVPEPAGPGAPAPDPANPDATLPDPANPDPANPDATLPDATLPDTTRASAGTAPSEAATESQGALALLRRSRALQAILLVTLAANLGMDGMSEVALPDLARTHWGAGGFGALTACLAAGTVLGTLAAARVGTPRRPVIFVSPVFLGLAVFLALVPYLGGLPGAAAALTIAGVMLGLGNVVMLTVLQRQTPPAVLGRVMSMLMLCSIGSFPVSVAVTGLLIGGVGPAPFFLLAGATLAIAQLTGLLSPAFRAYGSRPATVPAPAPIPSAPTPPKPEPAS